MAKREAEPIERVHVMLFASDRERLHQLFADNIGIAKAVRNMVRASLKRIDEKAAEKAQQLHLKEEDVSLD